LATQFTSTDVASLGGTSGGAGLVQKAYDKFIEFQLRDEPLLRSVADKRPVSPTTNGNVVVLQKYADLALATTALSETVDLDGVTVGTPTSVTITMQEFGNATTNTRALKLFSLTEIDPDIVTLMARNQADSIDALAMTTLRGGTNVIYSGATATSTATVTAAATLSTANIGKAVAKLRGNKASGKRGMDYWAGIHPDVAHDLMLEASSAGWVVPNAYGVDQSRIWAGEIGRYKGAFFVESPRLYVATDGAASAKVYRTIIAGQQAIAEAVAIEPQTVIGPQTDKLRRFFPIGWYGVLGFGRYREEALYRIESGSSIAV
jgi:N4-gp56 family major capsid protein